MERKLRTRQRLKKIGGHINDALELCWFAVRFHYIAIVTFVVQIYIFLKFSETLEIMYPILGFIILVFGVGLDIKNNQLQLI